MNPNDPILSELRAGDCPGVDLLETFRLHPEEAPAVGAHLRSCAACQAELDLLRSFQTAVPATAQEAADVEWITDRTKNRIANEVKPMRSWWERLFAGGMRAWAGAAVAAAVVLAVGVQWNASTSRLTDPPKELTGGDVVRAERSGIQILEPGPGAKLTAAPERFRWTAINGASRYEVTAIEVDGTETVLGSTPDTFLQASKGMSSRLFLPYKTVGVRIRARAADGRILAESKEVRIRIEP